MKTLQLAVLEMHLKKVNITQLEYVVFVATEIIVCVKKSFL